jgi:tetratricopeptide (TPR) repeat protein
MRRVIELEERTPYGSVPAPSRHAEALFEAGVLAVLLEDTLGAVASLDRAFAEGRYDDAAEQFLAWRDSVPECAVCGWFERAQVFRATEEPDSAIANLHRYLDADFLYRSESDAYKLWLAYRGLAELYQDQGEAARAVEYYGRFADLWKDADPPLQPRVRGAREAAQRLRGGP